MSSTRVARVMADIDRLIRPVGPFDPRWGWHDDHRAHDGTPAYLPAMQQVRSEFVALLDFCDEAGLLDGKCLQLGVGECDASHRVWCHAFQGGVMTIDWRGVWVDNFEFDGADTRSPDVQVFAAGQAPYDLLFVDADHSFDGVKLDHETYGPLVRPGGVIAFHDSLERKGYAEVEVWRYVNGLPGVVHRAEHSEVGLAWIRTQ